MPKKHHESVGGAVRTWRAAIAGALGAGALACAAVAEDPGLARHFGFDEARTIVVDDGCGPFIAADLNGDGLGDLAVVNNRKSRVELFLQRRVPLSDEEVERGQRINELPPSAWYERVEVSVAHRVSALLAHDVDGDGRMDLVYAGQPAEVVVMRQSAPGQFEAGPRRRVRGLTATRSSFAIADVVDGPRPELLAGVDGQIHVFALTKEGLSGDPTALGSGSSESTIVAFFCEDFDGDGLQDILGVIPEAAAPLRLWKQRGVRGGTGGGEKRGEIGPEMRFESPALREVEPVRLPGQAAAAIGVIERASRRIALYDLVRKGVERESPGVERDVQGVVFPFADKSARERSVIVADIDGDGLEDLVATNPAGASLLFFRQEKGEGMQTARSFSAFKSPKTVAAGQWDADGPLEVFVMSEAEKTLGVCQYDPGTGLLSFPQPISIATPGATPVAMNAVVVEGRPAVAVVVKDKRAHTLEIHRPGEAPATIALEEVTKPAQSILAADVNHDGADDILLLTPGAPMVVVLTDAAGKPARVLTEKTMPQFGLVDEAGPSNTALLDVTGDGAAELLIADENFVRACEYSDGSGWRVVEQITLPDSATKFTGLAVLAAPAGGGEPTVVAADGASGRIAMIRRPAPGEPWAVAETLRLGGFQLSALRAGRFTGGGAPSLIALSDEAFAVTPLEGERWALEPFATHRSDEENRLEHEMSVGDLNSDGFTDLVVLDAGEQMCEIFTISAARRLLHAMEFKVFETRLFFQGEDREFEPSDAVVADLTGDGRDDLALLVHDRVIVYPQMMKK